MNSVKNKQGSVISNFDDLVKASEFYDLYSTTRIRVTLNGTEAPSITSNEVRRTIHDISWGKVTGEDRITVDLSRDAEAFMLQKLAALYSLPHDFKWTSELEECQHYTNS